MGILRIFFVHDRYPLLCPGIGNVGARSCKKKKKGKKGRREKIGKICIGSGSGFLKNSETDGGKMTL